MVGQVRAFLHDVCVGQAWAVSRRLCRRCVSVSFFHRHAFWFGLLEAKNAKTNLIIAVNWGCKVYGGSGACFSA